MPALMQEIIDSIRKNLRDGNYYAALFMAIILPSICGALESDNGEDTKAKYIDWYNRYIDDLMLKGEDCYALRCSLLHQGRTTHRSSSFARVLFTYPSPSRTTFHNNFTEGGLNLDIPLFCESVLRAVEKWQAEVENTANYQRNIANTIRLYPNGLGPYMGGIPLIS
jgi:hypothetical protein